MNNNLDFTSILSNSKNLPDILKFYKKNFPKKKFLFKKDDSKWVGDSFEEINLRVNKIISVFQSLGIKRSDRILLLSSNRIEWVEFDIAIMGAGAISVPSFVTNNEDDNTYIIKDSNPKIVILEDDHIFRKNQSCLKDFDIKRVITIEKSSSFLDYKQIISQKPKKIIKPKVKKNDISTIIYTSGTSGNPKGVVLSHKAILDNLNSALDIIGEFGINEERFISFLPLSHSYERMAGLYFPMLINAEIYFCTSLEKLLYELKEVKPTIFSAVPRLYENIYKKVKKRFIGSNQVKNKIFDMIFKYIRNENKISINYLLGKILVQTLLTKKIKNMFGGNIKALISGGAALNPEIGLFFNKIGFFLLQGYGQTEASPLISCNTKSKNDARTVGFPVKNVKVKISNQNEILVKGNNVMLGYWKNKKLTNETIKKNWLHTGDLGFFDNKGRLIINGRKKDLIVTSGGDNISVQKIENILTEQVGIDQAVIFGDNKPYLVALLYSEEKLDDSKIKLILRFTNSKLNSVEKIRKYILLNKPLTYEDGFLTQTQKIKKREVYKFFKDKIESLY